MRKLDLLVGKWTIRGKSYPVTGTPTEFSEAGETTWTLRGRYLLIRSTTTRENLPPLETLRRIGYDPQAKQYRMWAL
jgi:hypothetical protein